MLDRNHVRVTGKQDLYGRIKLDDGQPLEERDEVLIQLNDGEKISVSTSLLVKQADGSYYLPVSRAELEGAEDHEGGESTVIPLVEEELEVHKRKVNTGKVRLTKKVEEYEEVVDEPTIRERIDIRRVEKNTVLDSPAEVRFEDETMIVPVMEEVVVVSKRLMLKEEIHITKVREQAREEKRFTLRKEHVQVERTPDSASERKNRGARE